MPHRGKSSGLPDREAREQAAERLLREHWQETDWDGDVEAVKRLNPALWALYMEKAT